MFRRACADQDFDIFRSAWYMKVDVRLPGKGNSNSHGARPVHLIITMIKWFGTSRLSIKNPEAGARTGTGWTGPRPKRETRGKKRNPKSESRIPNPESRKQMRVWALAGLGHNWLERQSWPHHAGRRYMPGYEPTLSHTHTHTPRRATLHARSARVCSGSEEGSYLRLIDLCIWRVRKKKKEGWLERQGWPHHPGRRHLPG